MINILFVGESWFFETTEYKGFDKFTSAGYQTATKWIEKALTCEDMCFTHIPCHEVSARFPSTLEEIKKYDVIMLSDVGYNTFLLHDDTFYKGIPTVNKLDLIKQFVEEGGAFVMIGGYLTFQGIEAKGNYHDSVIEEILPITMKCSDDRVELPQGYEIHVENKKHPIMDNVPEVFPIILGYNKLKAKDGAEVIARRNDDALISVWDYGKGRTLAYATDCSPHWASPELCEWEYYPVLWQNIVHYLTRK